MAEHTEEVEGAMRLALYQPDIPQNTGAMIRLAACMDVALDIIEPAGFTFNQRDLKRVAMDYAPLADVTRHVSWSAYLSAMAESGRRIVLLTTKSELTYTDFAFHRDDVLLLGRESAGVPEAVHEAVDARIKVPMMTGARSLNVALAAAIVLGEALRQTRPLPIV